MATLCALLLLCAWQGEARSEDNLVGILSIDTNGVSDATAEQFEAQVEEALEGDGKHAVSRKALRERLQGSEFLEGCYFGPCLTALRVASGVPLVLVARIQGEGSSYSFVITLVDTKTGMFTAQVAQTCPVCTVDEAIMTATLATIDLLNGGEIASGPTPTETAKAAVTQAKKAKASTQRENTSLRHVGWAFVGLGVASGVLGGVLWNQGDHRDLGIAGIASGVALATGGITMNLLSKKF